MRGLVWVVVAVSGRAFANPGGPPPGACSNMKPGPPHGQNAAHDPNNAPFILEANPIAHGQVNGEFK